MTPLIDREIFFGNPKISGAQISPDGRFISFIKPYNNVMNIWIKTKDADFDDAIPITNDTKRPIRSYFWSRDGKYVLYVQDKGGDENFRIYAVNPKEAKEGVIPETRNLTPYSNIRAFIISLPKKHENQIFVGLNDRDPAWHDFYSINIESGERTLLHKNEERLDGLTFDLDANIRLASRSLSDGGSEILEYNNGHLETILTSNLEETLSPIRFDKSGNVYFISNVGSPDLMGLYTYNFETKEMVFLESDPLSKVDLGNASFSNKTDELIATVYTGDKKRIYWKNEEFKSDFEFLENKFNSAEISITSTTRDEKHWLFYVNSDIDPGSAYYFDRNNKTIEFLYSPRPELPKEHLSKMTPVRYNSIDGLEIPAYITQPNDNTSMQAAVILVHGGPWARDHWGYNSFAQFLANRGYVVLQPNFRGSTGFGKSFLNAAINEWGEKMQDDITAGKKFLVNNGYAHQDKIAIMGGSYGGYATLAGMTFTPLEYACGVSIVGPSNLFTLLETIPAYWESARAMFHKRMGDPNTKEGRAQLKKQSPFFYAKDIKKPLMVAQGGNDPRVKKSESDQIVIAMRDLNLPVEYINFPDEGHGFAKPDNNMAFIAVMEKFLATHLGGRYQKSIPDKIKSIIQNVTVDIKELEMPQVVTDQMKKEELHEVGPLSEDSSISYEISFDMQGQKMQFDISRNIKVNSERISVKDHSSSAMGDMLDEGTVNQLTFQPVKRLVEQGPLKMNYNFSDKNLSGSVNMQGNLSEINETFEDSFIMDGPTLDLYLTHLPLSIGFTRYLRILDTTNRKIQTYSFVVQKEEDIQGYNCFRCFLNALDGQEKSQTLWIYKSTHPVLVKKHAVINEMGGAIMELMLKER